MSVFLSLIFRNDITKYFWIAERVLLSFYFTAKLVHYKEVKFGNLFAVFEEKLKENDTMWVR